MPATVSAQGDVTPPLVSSFWLDRTTVDVSLGPQTIYGRFEATDDLSGFDVRNDGYLWGYVQLVISESSGRVIYSKRPNGSDGFQVIVNEGRRILAEFSLTVDTYVPNGTYYLNRLQFYDKAGNLFVASKDWLQQRGFPNSVTVTRSGTGGSTEITRSLSLPHYAAGDGWTTRIYIYGKSLSGLIFQTTVYDSQGQVIKQKDAFVQGAEPALALIDFEGSTSLEMGWIELKAKGTSAKSFCAVAMYSNAILRQSASSAPTCITASGYLTGALGKLAYVFDHRENAVSGFAFTNSGTDARNVKLTWLDQNNLLLQQDAFFLESSRHHVIESRGARGTTGLVVMECTPDCSGISSVGFRFNASGSFTLMPFIRLE